MLNFIFIIVLLFLWNIFKNELKLFLSSMGILTNLNLDFEQSTELNVIKTNTNGVFYQHPNSINFTKDKLENSPKVYMIATITFLKFFHILFILIFFMLNIFKYLNDNKISFLSLALNLHNFIILLIFYILNWTLPFKYFFFFLIKFNYKNAFIFYNLNNFNYSIIYQEIYNFLYFLVL